MKRSEMLEIIDYIVTNSKLSAYVDLPFDRVRELEAELADSILDEVEKNMLPPRAKLGVLQIEDNAWESENV